MRNSNKFNLLTCTALSSLAMMFAMTPANALPGQNINAVIKWAKTKPKLPRLTYSSEAHGYSGTKGNLYFYVDVPSENGIVAKEGITVSGDSSLKFTAKNVKAVKLIQTIYNANIANDFSQSRRITKVGRDHYYKGQKYAYILAEVQGGSAFQIIKLQKLQAEINNAKYCQTHECDL